MRISLITVVYNSASTIRDTLESVSAQTYKDIEYIIVDGLSDDCTIDIIKEYMPRFNSRINFVSEKDNGLYDAMNKGILMATGDVIGFINSDDQFCDPRAIEKIVKIFNRDETLDSVYADLYYVDKDNVNNIIRYWKTGCQRPFAKGWHPAHPTFYVKKDVYEKFGIFNLKFKLAADFELMLRFIEKEQISIAYLPDPIVKMRLGGATSKNLKNIREQNIECLKAFKMNKINVSLFYPLYRLIPKLKQYFCRYEK